MSIVGKPRSYHKKFLFTVEIEGIGSAAFQKCGELKATVAKIQQWEGGAIVATTSPGRMQTADVTLDRGQTTDLDLWLWFKQVCDAAAQTGVVDDQYKRNPSIVQRDRDGSEISRWNLVRAWPVEFSAGDWDNTADANKIESTTLTYEYFEPSNDQSDPTATG